ncbi:alpha/beta hydrolase [Modestobacter marinus]|uniref:alpha/beta hydrolase n=1 Tax=Modestobacter marinus TaxID=477641 RepID=UPI001C97FDAC|nr:alpha/beta hydrolase [Modestobacter marinus]
MTAPAQLAGWDVDLLRATVGARAGTPDRLTGWRMRVEAVGRRLGGAECWSGPAGAVAAEAVVELATVAARASAALSASFESLQLLTHEAALGQEEAARALAVAAAAGLSWGEHGRAAGLPPAPVSSMAPDQLGEVLARRVAAERAAAAADALAEDAAVAAARALRAAETAGEPLAEVRVPAGTALTFGALAARWAPSGPVPAPAVPAVDAPAAASWWAALPAAEQLAAVRSSPAEVGALDGLPAWARDQANRLVLADALRRLPEGSAGHATAVAVAGRLAALEDAGRPGQLLQFDPAGDRVAVAVGDLDTADAVAVLVPGILTTPADDLDAVLVDALAVAAAAGPGPAIAAVAWLGYRTPRLGPSMASPRLARRGGADLDRALDGLAAARAVPGVPPRPRTTVVAHSYGTVVTGEAVRAPGRIAADALVLLGSPGLTGGAAEDLEAGEVHGAWSVADPVSWLQWFGDTPMDPSFGDAPLPTELTQGHVDYLDPDRPTLAAIGAVVAGTRG